MNNTNEVTRWQVDGMLCHSDGEPEDVTLTTFVKLNTRSEAKRVLNCGIPSLTIGMNKGDIFSPDFRTLKRVKEG